VEVADDEERPRARREPEPRAPAWHPALGGYEEVEGGGEEQQQQELGGHGGRLGSQRSSGGWSGNGSVLEEPSRVLLCDARITQFACIHGP